MALIFTYFPTGSGSCALLEISECQEHLWINSNVDRLSLMQNIFSLRARSHLATTMCFLCRHVRTVTLMTMQPFLTTWLERQKSVSLSSSVNGPIGHHCITSIKNLWIPRKCPNFLYSFKILSTLKMVFTGVVFLQYQWSTQPKLTPCMRGESAWMERLKRTFRHIPWGSHQRKTTSLTIS